jgi:hydrogenase maturation protein HypF
MAPVVLDQARIARDEHDVAVVGLSGGVFQNRVLTDQVMELLRGDGFEVLLPSILPVNDAGLSFGQAAEMAARDNQD